MKTYLFETTTGSHLYGLANEHSDIDTFRAYTGTMGHANRNGHQKITGDDDATEMPLGAWISQAALGTPQALEAMWSPIAEPSTIDALRWNFYPDTAKATHAYHNAILSLFRYGEMNDGAKQFKMHRHTLRLTWNLNSILRTGRFSPQMTEQEAARATEMTMENGTMDLMQELLTRESLISLRFRPKK